MAPKREKRTNKGVSLAKGPVAIIGMILLAYGVTALIFGGRSFTTHALSGTVNGKTWLGLEVNGWSDLLFIGSGAALMFGAPIHWGAKSLSLIVGLVMAVAAVISLVDGDDVLGIFAANGRTTLVWAIVAAVLIILALLPRVGGDKKRKDDREAPPRDRAYENRRAEPVRTVDEERAARHRDAGSSTGSVASGDQRPRSSR
jgi:hypothetical protein